MADKLVETATAAEDPLRAMAEMIADFVMEAQVTARVGAEPHERTPDGRRIATGAASVGGTRAWGR